MFTWLRPTHSIRPGALPRQHDRTFVCKSSFGTTPDGTQKATRYPLVPTLALTGLILILYLGQCLKQEPAQTAPTVPPRIRARFETIQCLVRPGAANLPVTFQKAPRSPQAGTKSGEVWIADWSSPGSYDSGFRVMLDGRAGQILRICGEYAVGRTGITLAATERKGEEGAGELQTREDAVQAARFYLQCLGERSLPMVAVAMPYSSGLDAWCMTPRVHNEHNQIWRMILEAKSGVLLYFAQ